MTRRPNFFLVGAAKCGTSSMYEYLKGHPDIYAPIKEPLFVQFVPDIQARRVEQVRSEREYLGFYAGDAGQRYLIDATPNYLYSSRAAELIHKFSPDAKIMIMLRHPVAMMYSLHSHNLFTFTEEIADFEQALAAEADRMAGRRVPRRATIVESLFYRGAADYAPQVERYIKVFGRERVHVVFFFQLVADTAGTFRDVLQFLDIDEQYRPDFRVVNSAEEHTKLRAYMSLYPRTRKLLLNTVPQKWYPTMTKVIEPFVPELKRPTPLLKETSLRLIDELEDSIRRLEDLLGIELPQWREPPNSRRHVTSPQVAEIRS